MQNYILWSNGVSNVNATNVVTLTEAHHHYQVVVTAVIDTCVARQKESVRVLAHGWNRNSIIKIKVV